MQSVFDKLYEGSLAGREFRNLLEIVTTEENIKLAYRNLKRNAGSKTPGTDGKTIRDLANLPESVLIQTIKQKFAWYQPQAVRRVEIPKGNGKTRPLGIPTILDRLIQQCVLQVMEPICEAKYCDTSNGFRPNRGVENALAQAEKEYFAITDYNSFVMGMHHYYGMATSANGDIQTLAYEIKIAIKNRLQGRVKRRNGQPIPEYAKRYARSKEIRFIGKTILLPIGYIQHHPPIHKKKSINKYTSAGRAEIHKNLECVDMSLLHILMRTPVADASIEYNDNRISLYAAQHGCCAVTKEKLHLDEIHCHHKTPKSQGGGDEYANLIILHERVHRLIHATSMDTITKIASTLELIPAQQKKLNKLRKQAGNEAINFEQFKGVCC